MTAAMTAAMTPDMTPGHAVKIVGKGGVETLELREHETRAPGYGEILVRVAAAGVNRADVMQRKGFYPAPPGAPADIPGLEYAGTVEALGEHAAPWNVGDAVMGIVAGGGLATHVVVNAREAIAVPSGMPLVEAAAIPEVYLTAFDALFTQAQLVMGEIALIHAVGSGVGTAALQLARAVGARPVGTSRTADKLERCKALGLEDGVVVNDGTFSQALLALTGGRFADVVLDTVGASYLAENIKALAVRGRMVSIGLLGGATAEFPLGLLLAKRATLIGSVLRSRPLEEKAALAQAFTKQALPLFARGMLKPVIDCVLPMSEIRQAHTRMESNESFGKIVMKWE